MARPHADDPLSSSQSRREGWIRVYFREADTLELRYETTMPAVPRVGEMVEFPSGRVVEVVGVGYLLDRGVGLGETSAVLHIKDAPDA